MLSQFQRMRRSGTPSHVICAAAVLALLPTISGAAEQRSFRHEEATIADVHRAIAACPIHKLMTTSEVVIDTISP